MRTIGFALFLPSFHLGFGLIRHVLLDFSGLEKDESMFSFTLPEEGREEAFLKEKVVTVSPGV